MKAVIFDVDGTLMNNNGLHVQAWKEAFLPYRDFDEAELLSYVGMGSEPYIQSLMPNLDAETRQAVRDHKRLIYKEIGAKAAPFPGAVEALREAKRRGLAVALASSASRVEIERYVALLGISGLVDAIITASDVARTKPDPDLFLAALDKLQVPAAEAFVVGDTSYDVLAASRAGMPTVAVLSGGIARATLEAAGAAMILSDVGELAERFDDVLARLAAREA